MCSNSNCNTIVITTTEQAELMMQALEAADRAATADNYAQERKRPIRWMTCTCCAQSYRGRQWWNQDCGYGLGDCCVEYCCGDIADGARSDCYGVSGIHFRIPAHEATPDPDIEGRTVKVCFENPAYDYSTSINGSRKAIADYFRGSRLDVAPYPHEQKETPVRLEFFTDSCGRHCSEDHYSARLVTVEL